MPTVWIGGMADKGSRERGKGAGTGTEGQLLSLASSSLNFGINAKLPAKECAAAICTDCSCV